VGYFDFVPYPSPFGLTITNRYPAAGQLTMLDLQLLPNINISPGSNLVFTFPTNNLLNNLFANDL
jgi:hypothetical protein